MQQQPDFFDPQLSYPQFSQPQAVYPPQFPPPYMPQGQQPMYPQPQFAPPPPGYSIPPQPYAYPQQQPYPYAPQQQGYPYLQQPYQQMLPQGVLPVNTFVNVNVQRSGPGFLVRALYFIFIGWWVGYVWLTIGFALCALIITLPVGLMMLNRLPQVLTLRAPGQQTNVRVATTIMPGGVVNTVDVNMSGTRQYNMLLRIVYFLLVGWWAGYLWANIGYFFCVIIIGLPLGLIMMDRLPMVLTLRRN